jgi:hypothetical protein
MTEEDFQKACLDRAQTIYLELVSLGGDPEKAFNHAFSRFKYESFKSQDAFSKLWYPHNE